MSNNIIYVAGEDFKKKPARTFITPCVQGDTNVVYDIEVQEADGSVFDITGATITAKRRSTESGSVYAIGGTLTITDASNGVFTWDVSADDTSVDGKFDVQFTFTFSGTQKAVSYNTIWEVYEELGATVTPTSPLVGVTQAEADLLNEYSTKRIAPYLGTITASGENIEDEFVDTLGRSSIQGDICHYTNFSDFKNYFAVKTGLGTAWSYVELTAI